MAKASRQGVAAVALRNSGHLGRIGEWPELAAQAGMVSVHFVNTTGGGILVAPHGGTDRRLSANPIAAGVPVEGGPPILVDISTCTIAEGKIRVAFNKHETAPRAAFSTALAVRQPILPRSTARLPARSCRWADTKATA